MDNYCKKETGKRLEEALKKAGIKIGNLSEELGVGKSTIYHWLQGTREPKYEVLHFLFKKYKINPNYILLGIGPPIFQNGEEGNQDIVINKIPPEQEVTMKSIYNHIIEVLENYETPWKIVPKSVVDLWTKDLSGKQSKILKYLKELPLKAFFTVYASFEIAANRIFFFANMYWEQMIHSIWRCYWALKNNVTPTPKDIAILGLFYTNKKDFIEAALELQNFLRRQKVVNWNFSEMEIKEALKTKWMFHPYREEEIQPAAYMYLRQAGVQLIDLAICKNLPQFCLVHSKAFWTTCPICREIANKA